MFTGDRSGDWLFGSLYRTGWANQATSTTRDDGLRLQGAFVTAAVRCAPPANRPSIQERDTCFPFLLGEIELLRNLAVVVALGGFAWDRALRAALARGGKRISPKPKFGHGTEVALGPWVLLGSYHPSQQNTFTKRLTEDMLDAVFSRAREISEG